jgi:hypothetical protein
LLHKPDWSIVRAKGHKVAKQKRIRQEKRPIENLTGLLDRLCSLVDCEKKPDATGPTVQVRQIFETIGRRSYGPLLLFLGLFSISPLTAVPGMTWASAALTLIIAVQLTIGMERPWVPKGLLDAPVSSGGLVKAVDFLRPTARRIDMLLRPRLDFLARFPFITVIGLMIMAAALITFPLGVIPFAPMVPGFAVVLFALGLVARDGFVLLLGGLLVAAAGYMAQEILMQLLHQGMGLVQRFGGS